MSFVNKKSLSKIFRKSYSLFLLSIPFLISLIGIILRIYLFLQSDYLQFDEAVVWNVSTLTVKNILFGNYYHVRFHPPLFYILVHLWQQLGNTELILRLPSLIFSLFSIPLIYIFLFNTFGKKVAIFGLFFYSISPFSLWWSSQLRVYPVLFFISLIYLVNYRELLKTSGKGVLFFIIIGSLGFQLDYSFIWIFLILNAHVTYLKLVYRKIIFFKKWLFINFIILINFLFYIFWIGNKTILSKNDLLWINKPSLKSILNIIFSLFYSSRYILVYQYSYLTNILFIFIILFIFVLCIGLIQKKSSLGVFILIIPIIISFLLSQIYPIFVDKNLYICSLGIIILLSLGINYIDNKNKLIGIFLEILITTSSFLFIPFFNNTEPNWKLLVSFKQSDIIKKDTKIITIPSWFLDTYKFYSHKYHLSSSQENILKENSKYISTKDMFSLIQKPYFPHECIIIDFLFNDPFYKIVTKDEIFLKLNMGFKYKKYLGVETWFFCN
ncbi:MAG: glycosyltransferase family 39 protein [Patescibacteria group bacterium]|nr:glycosyltransferase family 39 protein [Patescibacteria group bacterium]